jgi:hypothetical protein
LVLSLSIANRRNAEALVGISGSLRPDGVGVFAMEIEGVLNTYCGLMESIKARAALMLNLLSDKRGLPPFCVAEILELQIRVISETLAIACLC